MRKLVYTFFLSVLALGLSYAQLPNRVVIDNFESSAADSTYLLGKEGNTVFTVIDDASDKVEGSKAMRLRINIPSGIHDWGSYGQLIYTIPAESEPLNWSGSDSLSLWIKVVDPPANPQNIAFRFHIHDRPVASGNSEEHVYENATILDASKGWVNLKVPLFDRESDGQLNPDSTGFCVVPSNWNPPPQNNKRLDLDKVVGYNITFVTANGTGDSIEVLYDDFSRFGYNQAAWWAFNGKVVNALKWGVWGWPTNGTGTLEENAGSSEGKAGIKLHYLPQWNGLYFNFTPLNMAGNWKFNDTLKLKIKAPAGMETIRVQFANEALKAENGDIPALRYSLTKADYNWDGTWKEVKVVMDTATWDVEKPGFDPAVADKFEIVIDGDLNTMEGDVYFDDIWLGSPEFDVIPPAMPTNFLITQNEYENFISWKDTENETGEKYTIYFSKNPITDVTAAGVSIAKAGIGENGESYSHILRSPNSDKSVTYYYAIMCFDAAGNPSEVVSSGAITNTAKGVVTLSLNAPVNFTADGNLSEWKQITPFKIYAGQGHGYLPPNQPVPDTNDLLVRSYVAFDNEYLYVAFDVIDDIYSNDPAKSTYLNDCPDLFLGLFNSTGVTHTSYKRGAEPDYHFRFYTDRAFLDGGSDSVAAGDDYIFYEKDAGDGYIVESRINLANLASRMHDSLFVPIRGLNIPIDFAINDADATGERESLLCLSPDNNDNSWSNPALWVNTWIEDDVIGVDDEPNFSPKQYSLSQNYPNPFNPSTTIKYSLQMPGLVKIKVYNILGAEVAVLVNEIQTVGDHHVILNASHLSSGVYFYSIESGSFRDVKKMVFLK